MKRKLFAGVFILLVTILAARGGEWTITQSAPYVIIPDSVSASGKSFQVNNQPIDLRPLLYATDTTGKAGGNAVDTFQVQFDAYFWAETGSDNVGRAPLDSFWMFWTTAGFGNPHDTTQYGISARKFVLDSSTYKGRLTPTTDKNPTVVNLYGTYRSGGAKPYTMPTFLYLCSKSYTDSAGTGVSKVVSDSGAHHHSKVYSYIRFFVKQ